MPVRHDLAIVEAEHAKSLGVQIGVTNCVTLFMGVLEMLATIDLDNQHCGVRNEVGYVRTDGDLSPESGAIQSVGAECVPDDPLRGSHILSQRTCARPHARGDTPLRL
jgi:hypothetical protein